MSSILRDVVSPWQLAVRSGLPAWGWPVLLPVVLLLAAGHLVSLPFCWLKAGLRRVLRPLTRTKLYQRLDRWLSMPVALDRRKPLDTFETIRRMQLLRRVLIPVLVLEWVCLLGMGLLGAIALIGWYPEAGDQVVAGLFPMVVLGAVAAIISSSCRETYQRWRKLKQTLCGQCGYNRAYIAPDQCPECGTTEPAVSPGQVPGDWIPWERLMTGGAAFVPFGLFGSIGPLTGHLSTYLPHLWLGLALLALTISLTVLAGGGLIVTWCSANDSCR